MTPTLRIDFTVEDLDNSLGLPHRKICLVAIALKGSR